MKMKVIAVLAVVALLAGCVSYPVGMPQTEVRTNIPWHTTTVTIVNGTGFVMDVIHDGRLVRQELKAGQHFVAELYNLSGSSAQSSFVVIARDGEKLAGTASRTFYVRGYSRQSEVWTILRWDIRN